MIDPSDALVSYLLNPDGPFSPSTIWRSEVADSGPVYFRTEKAGWETASGPLSVNITPLPIEWQWGETTFPYDGQERCPVAVPTNAFAKDTVSLTVEGAARDVGYHTARITAVTDQHLPPAPANYKLPDDKGLTVQFRIVYGTAAVDTPPTAKPLTYNGQDQALVDRGTSAQGTLLYSLQEAGPYHEAIPAQTLSGSYRVWYKIMGDRNHYDSMPQALDVTIQAKALPPQTGGRSLLALSLLLMGGSLAGLVLAATISKKRSALK